MIKEGTFKSVKMAYGNHFDEVMQAFLSKGWGVQHIVTPDYERGKNIHYITFVAGEHAKDVELNLPNASIIN